MERDEFLKKFGIGLMAACVGCGIASCGSGSKNDSPTPSGSTPTGPAKGSGNVLTADLNTELTTVGSSKVSNGVILARVAAGNTAAAFTAVQVACTHEGTSIGYSNAQGIFICPLHGSQFSKTGAVLQGPAATPLQQYTISIAATTLTVIA
jgi:cytochrome b6-f complex iron-sulfur subunit